MVFAMSFVAGMLSGYVRFPLYFLFPIVVERERETNILSAYYYYYFKRRRARMGLNYFVVLHFLIRPSPYFLVFEILFFPHFHWTISLHFLHLLLLGNPS